MKVADKFSVVFVVAACSFIVNWSSGLDRYIRGGLWCNCCAVATLVNYFTFKTIKNSFFLGCLLMVAIVCDKVTVRDKF